MSGGGAGQRDQHGVATEERGRDCEGVVTSRLLLHLHQSVHSTQAAEYLHQQKKPGFLAMNVFG